MKSIEQGSGATGATSGLPLPISDSLNYSSLGLLGLPRGYLCQPGNHLITVLWGYSLDYSALGLPRGYLRQPANHWNTVLWGYCGYLGATFATQQIIGGATMGLPLPIGKSS